MTEICFGVILCRLRKEKALTQRELAKLLGIHVTTVKNWESDMCLPDIRNVCALADLFHVTTDYLLGREYSDVISLDGLNYAERRQLLHIAQAYIDTLPKTQ